MLSHNKDSRNWFYTSFFESFYKWCDPKVLLKLFRIPPHVNLLQHKMSITNTPSSLSCKLFYFLIFFSMEKIYIVELTQEKRIFINTFEFSSWREYFVTLCLSSFYFFLPFEPFAFEDFSSFCWNISII